MDEYSKHHLKQRKIVFSSIVLLLFLSLFYGFFKIQIAGGDKYYEIAVDNSVRQLTQYPVRGTIRDKTGKILVDNRPSFFVSVIPKQITDHTIEMLTNILKVEIADIKDKIKGRNSFRPVIIERDLDYKTVATLEEMRMKIPGVLLEVENKRFYPQDVYSAHIFGYVGEVTREEARENKNFDPGDLIGKSGLEYNYDENLRGVKGIQFVRVDAEGRDLGMVNEGKNIEAQSGMDLYLTMDYAYQQFAESLMVDKRGAIVALDTRDGNLLAFVSKPDYDPRLLTGKISTEIWQKLQTDSLHPMFNRVIQSTYPPGSTYKLIAAIAALEEGIITPRWKAYCPGYYRIGRKIIHCWKADGHGEMSILPAIKNSCNVFFYQLGLKIGLETWAKYSKKFFFGQFTGIDLPNEIKGLVPTVAYFNQRYGENGWTKGNLANLAIGQGELLTTPLQMAQFAAIIANKGVVNTPHLVDYLYNKKNNKRIPFPKKTEYVEGISDEVYNLIREGMLSVVHGGTGWRASVYGIQVAGKTGTAQNPHGADHAWFIGFAPYDDPKIAIAVIIENGGGGGAFAAPIAGYCLEKFFYNRLLPRKVAKKDTFNIDTLEQAIPLKIENIPRIEAEAVEMN